MSHHRLNDRRRVVADVGLALPSPPSPSRQGGDGFSGADVKMPLTPPAAIYVTTMRLVGGEGGVWVWFNVEVPL
jgi:hypothetical protein